MSQRTGRGPCARLLPRRSKLSGASHIDQPEKGREMPETVSPSDLFRRIVEAVAQRRQSEILDDCYAEDVVVEHPFMIPEPTTTLGREQLRKRMTSLKNLPIMMEIGGIIVHETAGSFRHVTTTTMRGLNSWRRNSKSATPRVPIALG